MFSSNKKKSTIDPEQRELIENAQRRIRQKKRLMMHFVALLAGSILFIVLNVVLNIGENIKPLNIQWFVWAILIWVFFFLIHLINVLLVNKLMGKEWEEKQLQRLVKKQQKRIEELQQKVDKKHPLPDNNSSFKIEPKDDNNPNSINA